MKSKSTFFQTKRNAIVIGNIILGLILFTGLFTKAQTPVAYYPFSGNANDAVGTNHGTVNGATLTTDRFGNANSAYSFDGVDDFIGLNYNFGPFTELTVSAWYKVTATSPELQAIVSSDHTAKLLHMQISTSGDADNAVYFNPGPGNLLLTHTMPVLNQWRQVTISSKSGESKLYINGVLTDTDNSTFTSTTAADLLRIGSGYLNGRFFNGVIDEVRIYNTALTAAQIIVDMGNIPLPTAICCGGINAGCSSDNANNVNGGHAGGFGCGGGGAGYYGGHGGNGLFGGGGGGAAGLNQPNRSGGAGGSGVVVVEMVNAQNEMVERNAYTGGSSFVIPANVTSAHVWAIGAGGGGAGATGSDGTSGGGGGAGGVAYKTFSVNSGDIFTYSLGVAGAGGIDANDGNAGTNTTVTFNSTTLIGGGGEGGKYNTNIDALGGTFSGGDSGSNGGNGKGASGDSGGGAGGGIGLSSNLSISCAGGVGAAANDVSGLFEVLTVQQQVFLIADYHFNGNAADSSGNNLHGTIIGSPTFSTDRNGLANGAIVFDGNVANRVEVNDTSLLQAASITIAAWVKFNSLGGIQTIVHKTLGSGSSDSWTHGTENSNLSSWHFNNAGGGPYSQVTSPIVSNQWYYAVSTFDNTTKQHKLYIDGILKATNTFNNPIGYDNSKMYFGAGIENGGLAYPMNGVVDEVKIYGTALSANQIIEEYENAINTTLPGSGNALSFDGTNDFVQIPHSSNIDFSLNDNFSIDFWLKIPSGNQPNTTAEHNIIFEKRNPSSLGNCPFQIRYENQTSSSPGRIGFLRYSGSTEVYVYNLLPQNDDKFHHITCVKNGPTLLFYVDGILNNTKPDLTAGSTNTSSDLYIGSRGGSSLFLKSDLDEVRIWNTALTESQIRDRMCRKITSSDALFSNLVAYYNFDESTGNTTFDGSVNANNGTLVNGPTRVTSGAAIGNTSAHSYAGASATINLAHPTRGDDLTATLTAGAAAGIQVYHVNEEPNTRSGVSGLATNNAYFGTFVVGGSSPTYNAVYNYDGILNIVSEVGLGLFGRNNNSITAWNAENASINTTANTLSINGIAGNQKELIVGENSAGSISASQSSCLAIVPSPLTGTTAFNGVPGITYQWQDSIVGGTWTTIAGATNGTTFAPPLLNAPKYYRRLATLNALTIPSNQVFLDIRGAVPSSTVPVNQWNVYAYNGTDLNLGAGTTYQGYYTVSGLVVNSESLWNQNAAPSTAPGYKGCDVNQAPWTLAVKRQGFPAGNYILNITSVDNGVRVYLNGNQIFAAGGFGPYNNITLGALTSASIIEVRAENSGGPGYLNFNLQISALQGGTISANQSSCGSFIPAVLNNVNIAYGGSLLNISYQWQQSPNNVTFTDIGGATSGTYQPASVSSDTYFRRKALNANNETALSNVVFIDLTGPTFYADTDGDGFGDPNNTIIACSLPLGYQTNNTDCNDTDPLQHPGQIWYTDMDNDGYVSSNGPGQPALTITQCSRPTGGKVSTELISTVGRDCNDYDPTINPTAQYLTISSSPDFSNGVFPLQGDPSTTFFFEAMYFDANNALPSVTFPRAYLDYESNNLINEPQDRIVVMTEFDAADQNTVDGKKYVGSISGLPNGNTWQTFLISEYSNTCQRGTGPFPHPDVLLQPNVQVFADYIEFSDENPPVSSPITITAYVGNPSDFAVQNVVVHLKNQAEISTVFSDITIPYIAANTSGVATWNITTPSFNGLCPMQVTVDYTNNIVETNELDNVAIALFNNGSVPVTGDIIVEAHVVPQTSFASANNILHLDFDATSFSNNSPVPPGLQVSGALVTFQIDETGATFTGFTGANGNIYIPFTAPVSPGVYHISGTVSSPPFTGNINPNITTFELINGNAPDYTVTLTAPVVTCLAGQSVSHTMVVNNNGLVASAVSTQLTLSIPGGNPSLLTFVVPPIAAGGNYTISNVNVQFPTAGTYNVCAQADVLQEITELNESNNSSCINITAALAIPDLEVIEGSSGSASICNPISLFASIRNLSGVSCSANTSRIVVKLGNTTIQTFNHLVPALGPSGVHSYNETFIPTIPGTYTYTVEADVNHVVTEANESNNINSFTITCTPCLPDLVAENCDLAATSATNYASGNMTLSATIVNVGEAATSLPVTVRFQFSNNTFVTAVHTGGIPKGQSATVTASVPAFVNPGVTLKVIVDPNNTISEMNEANNESFPKATAWDLAFTNSVSGCGPDLTNFNYKPFFSYYLPVKIQNYTLYNAATVKVKYQISGPGLIGTVNLATIETYDVLTNCVVCPQGVSLSSPFVFPQVGFYTVTLTIDPDNAYNEVNESNNVWVVTIEVKNKPDLQVVSNYINPTLLNPAKGQPITVSVTYDNIGSSNLTDQMKMKLFVDNVAIDSVSGLSGLAAGNYATVNFPVPWSSTVPGTHVIKAFIDSDNGIIENDETNNIATRAITVGTSANLWVKSLSSPNYYPNLNDSINIKAKIENQGDLPTTALVSVYYVNNSLVDVLIKAQSISLQGNDSISLNIPWKVLDNKTKIVVVISNSSALEYDYTDNSAFIELGKMALFTEAFPACETGNKGTLTAYINGGEPPYAYAWSNGATTNSITTTASTYSITVFDATGQQVNGSDIIPPCTGTMLKAKCYIEGYFISDGIMASALTQSGIISPLEYTDTITVELHATTTGFPLSASCKAILHNNGTITCEFPLVELGSNRYIVIKHRSSIETWSALPVTIASVTNYDFSTAASKAFGSNQKDLLGNGTMWGIYSGDVSSSSDVQDGYVDFFDLNNIYNLNIESAYGYQPPDLTGDGYVDFFDLNLVYNNSITSIGMNTPQNPAKKPNLKKPFFFGIKSH